IAIAATAAAVTATAAATTAAATVAATAATAATTEAATRAIFLRTGLIDRQLTATEIGAIHLFRRGAGLIGRAHCDEREAARAAGHLVHRDVNVGHGTELAESGAEFVFRRLERQVTDVQFGVAHVISRRSTVCWQPVPNVGFEIIT